MKIIRIMSAGSDIGIHSGRPCCSGRKARCCLEVVLRVYIFSMDLLGSNVILIRYC
uniref:Uncharacterized protein n=1 Tax=Arundo donax TaxID=35708 RepID=A0A0A9HRC7_ARUDO